MNKNSLKGAECNREMQLDSNDGGGITYDHCS